MRGQGLEAEVSRLQLLEALEENRLKHEKEYHKARDGWRKLLTKELKELLDDVQADRSIAGDRVYIKNQKPQHFLKEYDEAIEMLKWVQGNTITITQEQFRAYVKDEWSWKSSWEASNTTYLANS